MDIFKSNWSNSDERMNISFPIAKVNREKRTVSGFATLDNGDKHGEIVTADASQKAFDSFRGNLREMHQPVAVGKVVSFKPQDYFDKSSGNTYHGIYVDAYISKGAEDTWQKVLDGTLTGFSIGGKINKASSSPSNPRGKVIEDYDLTELSLVDSPANPLANIFSIQKSSDGVMTIKGMAADTQIENVFWCPVDSVATTSGDESSDCIKCGDAMKNIGWVEKFDENKQESITKLINTFFTKDDAPGPDHSATTQDGDAGGIDSTTTINLHPDQSAVKKDENVSVELADEENLTMSKGGIAMETAENELVKSVDETETVEETTIEKSASEVSEIDSNELDIVKLIDGLRTDIKKSLNKVKKSTEEKTEELVASIQKSVDDYGTSTTELTGNVADIFQKFDEFKKSIDDRFNDIDKRLSALDGATAIKKSVDSAPVVSSDTSNSKASFWGNAFLSVDNI